MDLCVGVMRGQLKSPHVFAETHGFFLFFFFFLQGGGGQLLYDSRTDERSFVRTLLKTPDLSGHLQRTCHATPQFIRNPLIPSWCLVE